MTALSVDLTWRIALLGAVFAADLMVFISLCREELREWHLSRYSPEGEHIAPSSNTGELAENLVSAIVK
jgi:hypothetical protein